MALELTPKNLFDYWIDYIFAVEGFYSDVKHDRGGKTYWGLTENYLKRLKLAPPQNADEARSIYKIHIWNRWQVDKLPPLIGWTYADAIVNHGKYRAAILLQTGLGVDRDGQVGPKTLQAARDANVLSYWSAYRQARVNHYTNIIKRNSTQFKFYEGWMNRMFRMMEWAYSAKLLS